MKLNIGHTLNEIIEIEYLKKKKIMILKIVQKFGARNIEY